MIKSTKSYGLSCPDLLISGAIARGLEDIRQHPYLLDYAFQFLLRDELTKKIYGEKEFDKAKRWILENKINISMSTRLDDVKYPMISIALASQIEDRATFGDVNYDTNEDVNSENIAVQPVVIIPKFTPISYDRDTGIVTFPSGINTSNVFAGQIIMDTISNIGYPILEVVDGQSVKIDSDLQPNFTNAYIAPMESFYITSLGSIRYKQVYTIACITQGESIYCTYLVLLVKFILMRYKESLIEARGLDNSIISVGPMVPLRQGPSTEAETLWGCEITLTGTTVEWFPLAITPAIQGVKIHNIDAVGGFGSPVTIINEDEEEGWIK